MHRDRRWPTGGAAHVVAVAEVDCDRRDTCARAERAAALLRAPWTRCDWPAAVAQAIRLVVIEEAQCEVVDLAWSRTERQRPTLDRSGTSERRGCLKRKRGDR